MMWKDSDGYQMVKYKGRLMRVHKLLWTLAYGDVPPGMVIHHKDGNKENNSLDNLMLLTSQEHGRLHARLRREAKLAAIKLAEQESKVL